MPQRLLAEAPPQQRPLLALLVHAPAAHPSGSPLHFLPWLQLLQLQLLLLLLLLLLPLLFRVHGFEVSINLLVAGYSQGSSGLALQIITHAPVL